MTDSESRFYRRWVGANGAAEAAGLGATFLLGRWAGAPLPGRPPAGLVVGGAVAAVLLGVLLEGVLVGYAQARVLGPALPGLRPRAWVGATAVGAAAAWAVGMVPSTAAALAAGPEGAGADAGPSPLVVYPLAALLGLVTGPILGVAQWRVLRRHVHGAGRWLWANAAGWAAGMPIIFAGMDLVPWDRGRAGVAGPTIISGSESPAGTGGGEPW